MLHIARPVVHRRNGEILMAGYSWVRLVSFDPKTQRIRDMGMQKTAGHAATNGACMLNIRAKRYCRGYETVNGYG
ncbi:hypothetical protein SADUNF_Sadunf08G0004000 [Salix dunnii]|uniref:Uncharacterized protein n=1 Tax=Salix dunnii TaxID=1413687 RepID=A0A835JS98_9ROSI|nr:hypothetical protein SADUNF_Sadunf08G0004000 [Salix dunnii]